jgi:hypothetical protein
MIPLLRALNRWSKSKKKDIVKDVDFEYGEANKYFFGK